MTGAAEKHDHVVPTGIYVAVLLALMFLLALTLTAAFFDLDRITGWHYLNMTVAVLIAISKASLIILFFMHVKYGTKLVWAFAGAGFVWLGIMMTLSLADYFTRDYPESGPKANPTQLGPQIERPAGRHDAVVPGASALPVHPLTPDKIQFAFGELRIEY